MERGVEHGYLRDIHKLLACADAYEVCRVMQGAQIAVLNYARLYIVGNEDGAGELLSAVDNAVTYRAYLGD